MIHTAPERRVITFYSYKGGVGRTMALANVAYRLAHTHGLNVIAVDWDLEAPGLHRFFGVAPEVVASQSGILDYFIAWREAARRNDAEMPAEVSDVMSWLVPIDKEPHKPGFGAVSLLLAGRQDKTYDQRLAHFDWREFYADAAGAVAVEKLRAKLVESADVVLIDSRTGLTDAGGICTVQLPDGVVLVTGPNEQSIEGTERVARAIAKASIEERAERGPVKVWVALARAPSVEESYRAQEWFEKHEDWFEKGVAEGLWLKEDHLEGIQSLEIPHTSRWGFEEAVLNQAAKVGPRDPLALAYQRLSGTLLRWVRGEPALELRLGDEVPALTTAAKDIATLENEAKEAELRGDVLGLAMTLVDLAQALRHVGRFAEGIRKLDRATGIFLSRGAHFEHMRAMGALGAMLHIDERRDEAQEALTRSRGLAREIGDKAMEGLMLRSLAANKFEQGADEEAVRLFEEADALEQAPGAPAPVPVPLGVVKGLALYGSGRKEQAVGLLHHMINAARQKADTGTEESVISTDRKSTRLNSSHQI